MGALASSNFCTNIGNLLHGYQLCAGTEGKSPNATAIVTNSMTYFQDFLSSGGQSTDVLQVTLHQIRAFTLHLQQKRCFSNHRLNHVQDRGLSGYTINCYLRSLRIFFSWLVSEEIIQDNPFEKVKIPKPEPSSKQPDIADRMLGPMADMAGKQMANMFGKMFGFNLDEQANGGQPQVPSGWEYEDKGGAEQ